MNKKEQIVQTAISLFATNGYDATSIQKLAEASGVAQGLLYRHFKNKEDLLLHLVDIGMQQIAATLAPYADPSLSFAQAMQQHVTLSCQYIQAHTQLWRVLHGTRQYLASLQTPVEMPDIREAVIKPIKKKLQQGGHKDAETTAWILLSLIDGLTAMYLLHPEVYPLEKVKKTLIEKAESYA